MISIDLPPVNDRMTDKNGMLTDVWRDWFSTNIGTLVTYLTQFGVQLPPVTTAQRDALNGVVNGITLLNLTSGEPQIYLGGWKNLLHS